jgi:hypothetical protein
MRLRHVAAATIASAFITSMSSTAVFAAAYLASPHVVSALEWLDLVPRGWDENNKDAIDIGCAIVTLPPTLITARWFYAKALKAEQQIERGEL